jgi:hypothetical protein
VDGGEFRQRNQFARAAQRHQIILILHPQQSVLFCARILAHQRLTAPAQRRQIHRGKRHFREIQRCGLRVVICILVARNALRFLTRRRAHCFSAMPARVSQGASGVRMHMMPTGAAATPAHQARTGIPRFACGDICDVRRVLARGGQLLMRPRCGAALLMPRRRDRARHQHKPEAEKRS